MPHYVGADSDGIIQIISDTIFTNSNLQIVNLPPQLSGLEPQQLLLNFYVKDGVVQSKFVNKPARQLKVALVSNWKMKCGIASYSEHLYTHLVPHLGEFKLFIEDNNFIGSTHLIGKQIIDENQLSICWKRGESTHHLISEINNYNPDIVLIQHEFGLWHNARYWLSMMHQLARYRVIVVMHSVFHHQDKTICEAAIPEIIVHLEEARQVLKEEKQVPGEVYVIPHGCIANDNQTPLWNFYKSPHTFVQTGFGFRYKNFESSLRATSLLKEKYTDIFFTGLFSESPHNQIEHQRYYQDLNKLIKQLSIEENVALIRGYQSEASLDSYLRTNQAAVFPYDSDPNHIVYGASGAARLAMSKGIPIITSNIPHFSDLPSIKADSPQQIATSLDQLFSDPQIKQQQLKLQRNFLFEHSWEQTARRYLQIFEKAPSYS